MAVVWRNNIFYIFRHAHEGGGVRVGGNIHFTVTFVGCAHCFTYSRCIAGAIKHFHSQIA